MVLELQRNKNVLVEQCIGPLTLKRFFGEMPTLSRLPNTSTTPTRVILLFTRAIRPIYILTKLCWKTQHLWYLSHILEYLFTGNPQCRVTVSQVIVWILSLLVDVLRMFQLIAGTCGKLLLPLLPAPLLTQLFDICNSLLFSNAKMSLSTCTRATNRKW